MSNHAAGVVLWVSYFLHSFFLPFPSRQSLCSRCRMDKVFQVWFTSSLAILLNYNPKSHRKASESRSLCQNSILLSKLAPSLMVPNADTWTLGDVVGLLPCCYLSSLEHFWASLFHPSLKPKILLSVPHIYSISLQTETVPCSRSLRKRAFPFRQSAVWAPTDFIRLTNIVNHLSHTWSSASAPSSSSFPPCSATFDEQD